MPPYFGETNGPPFGDIPGTYGEIPGTVIGEIPFPSALAEVTMPPFGEIPGNVVGEIPGFAEVPFPPVFANIPIPPCMGDITSPSFGEVSTPGNK